MLLLITGLVLFLGIHSVGLLAPAFRQSAIARLGEGPWKGFYSLVSLGSFVAICVGYERARVEPVILWVPPVWLHWVVVVLMLPAMILLVAGNLPGSSLKARFGHPMLLSVKLWAFAHLLANGGLHDVLLFGGFLAWATADFIVLRRRDRANGTVYLSRGAGRDALVIGLGVVVYVALLFAGHTWMVGVAPIPG